MSGEALNAAATAYADSDAPAAKEVGRGLGVAASAATGAAIGATIGTIIPGIGNAVGGAAGAIVGAAVALGDWIGDLFGGEDPPPRWVQVRDAYGPRRMPRWWGPKKRMDHEKGTEAGARFFRYRRALEDGCARSECLFALAVMLREAGASGEVQARTVRAARASFLEEARALLSSDTAYRSTIGDKARDTSIARLWLEMRNRATTDKQRAAMEKIRRSWVANALVSLYRKRGLGYLQAIGVVRRWWPDRLNLAAQFVEQVKARADGARKTYLGGVQVPRLPTSGEDASKVAAAVAAMERYCAGRKDWIEPQAAAAQPQGPAAKRKPVRFRMAPIETPAPAAKPKQRPVLRRTSRPVVPRLRYGLPPFPVAVTRAVPWRIPR